MYSIIYRRAIFIILKHSKSFYYFIDNFQKLFYSFTFYTLSDKHNKVVQATFIEPSTYLLVTIDILLHYYKSFFYYFTLLHFIHFFYTTLEPSSTSLYIILSKPHLIHLLSILTLHYKIILEVFP